MATQVDIIQGIVGVQGNSDGVPSFLRLGKQGDLISSQLHGKYYEQAYRGNMYGFGISNTAATSLNAIATGLTATATPLIGAYNPQTSNVNLVLLRAIVVTSTVANSAVAPGGFMWCGAAGQAVSTGSIPINQKTLSAAGGQGKAFAMTTAMTGLSGSLSVMRASSISPFNAAGAATAVALVGGASSEELEGSLIVPPGGMVGLFAQVSSTTYSASVALVWEEVPV